jgi:hypothetical protein
VCLPPKPVFLLTKKFNTVTHKNKRNFERKKIINLNNNGIISQLAYPENASFISISNLFNLHKAQSKEHTPRKEIKKNTLCSVFYLLISPIVHIKEHMQTKKSTNPKINQ